MTDERWIQFTRAYTLANGSGFMKGSVFMARPDDYNHEAGLPQIWRDGKLVTIPAGVFKYVKRSNIW